MKYSDQTACIRKLICGFCCIGRLQKSGGKKIDIILITSKFFLELGTVLSINHTNSGKEIQNFLITK